MRQDDEEPYQPPWRRVWWEPWPVFALRKREPRRRLGRKFGFQYAIEDRRDRRQAALRRARRQFCFHALKRYHLNKLRRKRT